MNFATGAINTSICVISIRVRSHIPEQFVHNTAIFGEETSFFKVCAYANYSYLSSNVTNINKCFTSTSFFIIRKLCECLAWEVVLFKSEVPKVKILARYKFAAIWTLAVWGGYEVFEILDKKLSTYLHPVLFEVHEKWNFQFLTLHYKMTTNFH